MWGPRNITLAGMVPLIHPITVIVTSMDSGCTGITRMTVTSSIGTAGSINRTQDFTTTDTASNDATTDTNTVASPFLKKGIGITEGTTAGPTGTTTGKTGSIPIGSDLRSEIDFGGIERPLRIRMIFRSALNLVEAHFAAA